MRNGTIKSAAVVGIAVVAAALWGAGYWQGGRSARSLTTDAASVGVERTAAISSVERETQEAQEKRKTSETPLIRNFKELVENSFGKLKEQSYESSIVP